MGGAGLKSEAIGHAFHPGLAIRPVQERAWSCRLICSAQGRAEPAAGWGCRPRDGNTGTLYVSVFMHFLTENGSALFLEKL